MTLIQYLRGYIILDQLELVFFLDCEPFLVVVPTGVDVVAQIVLINVFIPPVCSDPHNVRMPIGDCGRFDQLCATLQHLDFLVVKGDLVSVLSDGRGSCYQGDSFAWRFKVGVFPVHVVVFGFVHGDFSESI